MDNERWKSIEGFPNYAVSNHGHVKRVVPMPMPHGGVFPIRTLKPHTTWNGYLRVELHHKKRLCSMAVHRLVLSAFLRQRKIGEEANHKNCIKTDNRIENLEWITPQQNRIHAKSQHRYPNKQSSPEWAKHQLAQTPRGTKHGAHLHPETIRRGEKNGMALLSSADVQAILKAPRKYGMHIALAQRFNVSRKTICNVLYGHTWKHLSHPTG